MRRCGLSARNCDAVDRATSSGLHCIDRYPYLLRFLDAASGRTAPRAGEGTPPAKAKLGRMDAGGAREKLLRLVRLLIRCVSISKTLWAFVSLLAICAFAKKGRPAIFNHTARIRRSERGNESLYLSEMALLSGATVFEDADVSLYYPQGIHPLRGAPLVRVSGFWVVLAALMSLGRTANKDSGVAQFFTECALWKLVFKLLKPKKVSVYVWYGKQAIVAAAKDLGLEVSDVQHGVIYPSHPFYDRRSLSLEDERRSLIPDTVLVYGQYWREKLIEAGWPSYQVSVIGYTLNTTRKKQGFVNRPYILYTAQPGTGPVIIRHVLSIQEQLAARGWVAVIAPHPMGLRDEFLHLASADIRILDDVDSYDLLRGSLVHISVSSTLLWESIYFGKPAYILDGGGSLENVTSELITLGFALSLTDGVLPKPFPLPECPAEEYFFSPRVDLSLLGLTR